MRLPIFIPPVLLTFTLGCGELAPPPTRSGPTPSSEPALWFEPPAEDGGVAPITRIHISVEGPPENAGPPVLVSGSVSSRSVQDLARGDVSESFRKRIRDIDWWAAPDGHIVVAASAPLDLAGRYSVVLPLLSWSQGWEVVESDPMPRLTRIWPPTAEATSTRLVVWCVGGLAVEEVQSSPMPLVLEPNLVEGTLDFGAFPGVGAGCLRWEARDPALDAELVPPTTLALADGRLARVGPGRISKAASLGETGAGACPDATYRLGPVCFDVEDDRMVIHTPQDPLLVSVRADARVWAAAISTDLPMTVRPLPPESTLSGVLKVARLDGTRSSVGFEVVTRSAMPHVTINEVMANPQGPEPQQEWVELFNDGLTEVALGGWRIEDTAGSSELPEAVLPPGGYALVVNESYTEDSWVDRPPAPGTLILRVSSLGKSGLANGGEPLRLVTPDGHSTSMVPAIESSSAGSSIARIRPDAPSSSPDSFVLQGDGGTPGSSNATDP